MKVETKTNPDMQQKNCEVVKNGSVNPTILYNDPDTNYKYNIPPTTPPIDCITHCK
jgi:hypothetical protein